MKYFVILNIILKARQWQKGMRDDITWPAKAYLCVYKA